jgi:lysophospholipase L1-like esterase
VSRSRRALLRTLSVALGLLTGLAVVEIAVRSLSLAPPLNPAYGSYAPDAFLPFKPRPSTRITGRTDEFDYDYRHNRQGFRDVEHATEKAAGTFRILGLGDSFTYGVGVTLEETYLSRLEQMLNARAGAHPRVEIVKAGIPRYFPEPERILLEKYGLAYRPDLVVVGFLPNDVIDTYFGLAAVTVSASGFLMTREAGELGPIGMQLYRHSHVGRLVLKRYVDWQVARKYRPRNDEAFQTNGSHERDWQTIEREYGRMAAVSASIGARLLVCHIPQKGPWTPPTRYPGDRLGAWARRHDVDFVDVLPAMERAAPTARLYYDKDGHCTAAGHAVIAQELYAYLTSHHLVP